MAEAMGTGVDMLEESHEEKGTMRRTMLPATSAGMRVDAVHITTTITRGMSAGIIIKAIMAIMAEAGPTMVTGTKRNS